MVERRGAGPPLRSTCRGGSKRRHQWPWIYVVTAHASFYLNMFVGVTQAFQKIPALHTLAPTGTEVPFASAQAAVLALFIWIGVLAVKKFHISPHAARPS